MTRKNESPRLAGTNAGATDAQEFQHNSTPLKFHQDDVAGLVLSRLDHVDSRGAGRWSARCPAHPDKSPSLSLALGERGVLIRCWAGCALDEIVMALGLTVSDLFYDRHRQATRALPKRMERAPFLDTAYSLFIHHSNALWIRGQAVLGNAKALDTSAWTDADFNVAMQALAQAYDDLERSDLLADMAAEMRAKILTKKRGAA